MIREQLDILLIPILTTILCNIADGNIIDYQRSRTRILKLECNLCQHSYYPKISFIRLTGSINFYFLLIAHWNAFGSNIEAIAIHLPLHVVEIYRSIFGNAQFCGCKIGEGINLIGFIFDKILDNDIILDSFICRYILILCKRNNLAVFYKGYYPALHVLCIYAIFPCQCCSGSRRGSCRKSHMDGNLVALVITSTASQYRVSTICGASRHKG